MPHVSRKKLSPKLSESILEQLFVYATDGRHGKRVLNDLCTDTEVEMLAKRLAALVLLIDGISVYRVSKTLKVSPSTAGRLRGRLSEGAYPNIRRAFHTKKQREEFWQALEKLSRGGLPEMGRGRWRWLDDLDVQQKRGRAGKPYDIS